ncbi:MAG: TetR/AcrR family transcriptional regulator [Actinomycetia bacterium]|nr:TetR/AcrR family transcriptional regulator [Actinomycetes bacterium]
MRPQAVAARLRRSDVARHSEILQATIGELQESGYDRMTMDAVAKRAGASKATLYRHWPNKAELVVAAIRHMRGDPEAALPDTGKLRDDLLALLTGTQTHPADDQLCVMRGMVSACGSDAELATAFYDKVVNTKRSAALKIIRRAQLRGDVSEATDIQFLVDTAPAMLIFRHLLTPYPVDENYLSRLVDEVWLPLLTANAPARPSAPVPAHP